MVNYNSFNKFNFTSALLSAALCSLSLKASAQSASFTWGPDLKLKADESYLYPVGSAGSVLYVLKEKSGVFSENEYWLDKLDKNALSFSGSVKILSKDALVKEGKAEIKPEFEGVWIQKDRILTLLSAYDKGNDCSVAYAGLYDDEDQHRELIRMARIPDAKRYNRGEFSFDRSPDSSKILVLQKMPFEKHENAEVGLSLFDGDLKKIKDTKITLNYLDKNVGIIQEQVDNQGNVVLLAKIDREKGVPKGEADYYFSLLEYTNQGDGKLEEYEIKLPGKYITDVSFTLNGSGDIVCMGFYANDNRNGIQGTFYIRISRDSHQILASSTKAFDRELVAEFTGEKNAGKGQGLAGFKVDEVIPTNDGGALVVSEQYFMNEVCSRDARGFVYCNYYFYYNSIVVIRIDATGNILWNAIVPKYQFSINDDGYYSGYAMLAGKNNLHFVYLDQPKNLTNTDPSTFKVMQAPARSTAMLATVSADGKVTRNPLFQTKQTDVILRPKFNRQLSDSTLLIMGMHKGTRTRLGILSINE